MAHTRQKIGFNVRRRQRLVARDGELLGLPLDLIFDHAIACGQLTRLQFFSPRQRHQ